MKELNITLADTANLMNSADYKERFKAEYYQLKIRRTKLEETVCKYNNGTLGFIPTCPVELLSDQLDVMKQYMDVLEERAKLEKIEL